MTLLAPAWLWLLPAAALYLLYLRRSGVQVTWTPRTAALAAAAVLAVAALSRPALPRKPVDIERQGSDVIFAVDISRSMQADDIRPSRLEGAKRLLESVVTANERDRFGVVAFTTNSIILSPLTRDDELLLHLFSGLDTSMVLSKGTDIAEALKLSRKLSHSEHPVVILLTDGGDALGYQTEAAWAKAHGLTVNVVMLATASGSTLREKDGKLLRDEEGSIVVSARNDAVDVLAEATGGTVIEGPDAAALSDTIARQGQKEVLSKTKVVLYRELFYYPLALALLAAMLGMTDFAARLGRRHA